MRRRRDRRIWFVGLAVFTAVFLFTFLNRCDGEVEVEAASLDNFDPGYIISDYQMGNYQAMSEAEIQEFLSRKNGCKNTNKELYESLTERYKTVHWHFKDGHFVCLSEEVFGEGVEYGEDLESLEVEGAEDESNGGSESVNDDGNKVDGATSDEVESLAVAGETAAHIIWQAAQDYKINPQVLIVLLEKEQGLITDPYPHSGQYRAATGYGCPDTAACSSKYYGFKNQVRNAAKMFRTVLDGGWTNFPLGKNYIQYNPSASCGGSVVEVKNLATSALYRYTPYQPNAAALAAGYGTAECGAYGNRNFYLYFEDWFGGIREEGVESGKMEPAGVSTIDETHTVEDGSYKLVLESDGRVIDIEGGVYDGMTNGEILLFRDKKKISQIANQVFELKHNSETGYYNIINPTTGLLLDVFNLGKDDGTPIIVWRANGGCNQDWSFVRGEGGDYEIVSRCSGKVLTATVDSDVVISERTASVNQKWKLVPVQTESSIVKIGEYQFVLEDGLALDIHGGIKDGMTSGLVVAYDAKADNDGTIGNQKFALEFDSNTQNYVVKNTESGLVLQENNGGLIVGTRKDDCSARWVFHKVSDDYYEIFSACGDVISWSNEKINNSTRLVVGNVGGVKLRMVGLDNSIDEKALYKIKIDDGVADIRGGVVPGMNLGNLIKYRDKASGYDNQVFKFDYDVEIDSYYIYNPASGMYMDVAEEKKEDNSAIIVYRFNGNCNQQWKIEKNESGYRIISVCSGKNLSFASDNIDGHLNLVISSKESNCSLVKL